MAARGLWGRAGRKCVNGRKVNDGKDFFLVQIADCRSGIFVHQFLYVYIYDNTTSTNLYTGST